MPHPLPSTFSWAILGILLIPACGRPAARQPARELSQSAALCPAGATVPGVDVSNYQGNINWGQVAGSGIKWAYVKATEGTDSQDPTFPGNWSGMAANGVLRGA